MRQLAVQRASLKGKRLEFRELCHKTGTGGPAAPVRWHAGSWPGARTTPNRRITRRIPVISHEIMALCRSGLRAKWS